MKEKDPVAVASFIKTKRNPLLVAGNLCDTVTFGGAAGLIDYAAAIARELNAAVAATANSVTGLRRRGIVKAKKMWVGEMLDFLRGPWRTQYMRRDGDQLEVLMEEKPDVLILIGYNPRVMSWLISGLDAVDTVALAPLSIDRATCTLSRSVSMAEWQRKLESLVAAL